MNHVEEKGRKLGYILFCFMYLFIVLFNMFFSKDKFSNVVFYSASAMFWVFAASDAFEKFKFTKNKTYLITSIFGGIATIEFLVNFIIITLK